jgi:NADPH:quinone reductase-like Zn-dependent oxidoreductase
MRVAGVQTFGAQVEHFELPDPRPPAPGAALLAVKAAGVGNWDDIVRTGGWDVGTRPPWRSEPKPPARFGRSDEV